MNMYQCFLDLDVWPAHAVVKVDDTGVGIDEGREAGCWTVGVSLSGNEAGVTPDELAKMSEAEKTRCAKRHLPFSPDTGPTTSSIRLPIFFLS